MGDHHAAPAVAHVRNVQGEPAFLVRRAAWVVHAEFVLAALQHGPDPRGHGLRIRCLGARQHGFAGVEVVDADRVGERRGRPVGLCEPPPDFVHRHDRALAVEHGHLLRHGVEDGGTESARLLAAPMEQHQQECERRDESGLDAGGKAHPPVTRGQVRERPGRPRPDHHDQRIPRDAPRRINTLHAIDFGDRDSRDAVPVPQLAHEFRPGHVLTDFRGVAGEPRTHDSVQAHERDDPVRAEVDLAIKAREIGRVDGDRDHAGGRAIGPVGAPGRHERPQAVDPPAHRLADEQVIGLCAEVNPDVLTVRERGAARPVGGEHHPAGRVGDDEVADQRGGGLQLPV